MNIQLSDYSVGLDNHVLFGGNTSVEDLENINKALAAGSITGRDTTNLTTASGSPLKVESLEKTLKVITYGENEMTMWKSIPKAPAFNTVEEYNQLTDYGQDRGGFNNEGELPVEEDATYVRRAQLIKFLGTTRSVTHPMTLVNTMIGSAIDRESKNGTLWILRKLDKALYTGNSTIVPQEFNGLLTQHAQNDQFLSVNDYMTSPQVIDLRGATMGEAFFETGSETIVENFGLGNQFYAPPKVLSDFVKNFYGNKFIQPNTEALSNGKMGQRVKTFESNFGDIGLNHDIFFNQAATKRSGAAATSLNAPAAPTTTNDDTAVTPVATDTLGKWDATGFGAGNYLWAVSALNRYGESALTVLYTTASAIVSGGAADLTFTATASTNPATGYQIYRTKKGDTGAGATFYPLFQISAGELAAGYDGGAAGTVRDRNRWLPGCNQGMLVQQDSEIVEFKQLAPLMKMDLAITSPAYRFMVLLYGTPFLYAPKKMIRYINIGQAAN